MVDIKCWRDNERICDYTCPAHSHFGGFKIGERLKHLKLRRGKCLIIEAIREGKPLPEIIKQELSLKK